MFVLKMKCNWKVLVDISNDGSEVISVNDGEGATYEMKLPVEASDDDGIFIDNCKSSKIH